MIRFILNVLWFICGGLVTGLGWLLAGVILAITIVGLPYAGAAWRIAGFAFWPFGKEIVSREILTGRQDVGTGPLGFLLNVIWIVLAGWWLVAGGRPYRGRGGRGDHDHRHPVRAEGPATGPDRHRPDRARGGQALGSNEKGAASRRPLDRSRAFEPQPGETIFSGRTYWSNSSFVR